MLIDALDRVAPEVGPELSKWTLESLRARGIDVRLKTTMPSAEAGHQALRRRRVRHRAARLDGRRQAEPAPRRHGPAAWSEGPPRGEREAPGRAEDTHEVVPGVWGLGDVAQVPDLTAEKQPAYYPPNAQNAVRQAVVAADNVVATITASRSRSTATRRSAPSPSYGVGKGAGNIKGVKMTNLLAWLAHRSYHVYAMPTLNRKVRIVIGWITGAVSGRDATSLIKETDPRRNFVEASKS